jgi:hypothetical protein
VSVIFVRYSFHSCTLADDQGDLSVDERYKSHKIIKFKSHPTLGWPLLPKMGDMNLQDCKDTIRAFATATYRQSVTP